MGMILGTAAYMAPEQAKGHRVDKRADVWAFGCVLFEMLTGKRAFEGTDVTDTLAAVLRSEPDWTALPAGLPAGVRQLARPAVSSRSARTGFATSRRRCSCWIRRRVHTPISGRRCAASAHDSCQSRPLSRA